MLDVTEARQALEALVGGQFMLVQTETKRLIMAAADAYALAVHFEACGIRGPDDALTRATYWGCGDGYECDKAKVLRAEIEGQKV